MSTLKWVVGVGVLALASFWLGRVSLRWADAPAPPLGSLAASWDGGVLLQQEVEAALAESGARRAANAEERRAAIASLARQSLLASVASAEGLARLPRVKQQCEAALVEALKARRQSAEAQVSEAAVRAAYDAELQHYSQPEKLQLAHILLRADAEGPKRAAALLRELTERSARDFYAFADAAHAQSIDGASKVAGGELPAMTPAQVAELWGDDVAEALRQLEPGAMLPRVVSSPRGLHVIRLVQRLPAAVTPFERVQDSIAARLRAEASTTAWTEYVRGVERNTGFELTTP